MADLNTYLNQINDCVTKEHGKVFAELISLSEVITITTYQQQKQSFSNKIQETKYNSKLLQLKKIDQIVRKTADLDSLLQNKIHPHGTNETQRESYCDMIASRLRAITSIFDSNYDDAFNYLSESITAFIKVFEVWSSQAMWKFTYDIRIMAKLANTVESAEKKADYYEEASRILNRCFQASSTDRTTDLSQSKKKAAMGIVNQMFHIYFKLNNLKLCKNVIKAMESPLYPALESYPLGQLITYRFFVGRLAAFDGNTQKAQQDLLFSFNKCPSTGSSAKNKRLILLYLIPMQLSLCRFPKKELLLQYGLNQFVGIVEAMKTGNIKLFNQCLSTNQNYFIQKGIYLILEKLKNIVYRNLFKKIYLLNHNSRVPIQNFVIALKWAENDTVDIDEAECIISNLIYNGYIKGYVCHKVGLILSPKDPFPQIWKS
ncbi:proteasome component region PCI domain-containing protein [Heterostelium album PN500]|uniref:Proteasome component region PCI domain-containing protein n=1 Tax=Heterostelium pallidum (strain ATCC 26659 / Pp 5 / PN500) TaxID=670386 RepID=D3B4Y2_HETP5|nr:proteasome component region PCI domain-containing protein [Heterostelium album PN500]EFA84380.1 proteasome component region PCI domain-containing protein [Heterostelium album PN500]|eukprot:XP_020436495.1 proteasome component region PCI domain-containing protein [Heterostelium album PN500]